MSHQAVWDAVDVSNCQGQILSKTDQHYWTSTSCFSIWDVWCGISQPGTTNSNASLITKEGKHKEIFRQHLENMIIRKNQSNDLPAAGINQMGCFASPSSASAATMSRSSLLPISTSTSHRQICLYHITFPIYCIFSVCHQWVALSQTLMGTLAGLCSVSVEDSSPSLQLHHLIQL